MKKKYGLSVLISVMALTAAVTFILTLSFSQRLFNRKITEINRLSEKYQRLDELDKKVQESYYKDVDTDDLIDGMLDGYIRGLGDRYSTYRSKKELADYNDNTKGVYPGIGITVQRQENGDVPILSVLEGGGAEKAGIEAGDMLVAVDGMSVQSDYSKAIDAIAGEVGTTVAITVQKHDSGENKTYQVKRIQIEETTVESDMLENNVGYIRITKFRTVTVEQFEDAFQKLRHDGAEGFIFDVRNNGGGVLDALEKMVDPLLPEGELAFSYDKQGNASTIIKSDSKFIDMPYVVLTNENTASAAELFACLMRDYGNALLVGEKTFGKGIMQTTFSLSQGGVTLTTATYASGKTPCYHEIGLEPDVLSVLDANAQEDTQLADAMDVIMERLADDAAA